MAKAKTKAAVKRKAAKPVASAAKKSKKAAAAKTVKPAKAAVAKATTVAAAKPAKKVVVAVAAAPAAATAPKREPLTLPSKNVVEAPKPAPAPAPRKEMVAAQRADLPPEAGFTLLVDGHFKNDFVELKQAKSAAAELKERFPMLRVEIYDAAKKERLPV